MDIGRSLNVKFIGSSSSATISLRRRMDEMPANGVSGRTATNNAVGSCGWTLSCPAAPAVSLPVPHRGVEVGVPTLADPATVSLPSHTNDNFPGVDPGEDVAEREGD